MIRVNISRERLGTVQACMKAKGVDPMARAHRKNNNQRVYRMVFGSIYLLYIQKAEKKGRSAEEVDEIITREEMVSGLTL